MATRFECTGCGAKLKSAADPGESLECPKCGATVTIPDFELAEEGSPQPPPAELRRPKAAWEYSDDWKRVRFGLLLCIIASCLTVAELVAGEVIDRYVDRVARRPFSATELYIGLAIGVVIGAFRIAAKAECRHVPRQWVSRPLLLTCVGIEVALIVTITATTVVVARTRAAEPPPDDSDIPAEIRKHLSASEQQAYRDALRQGYGANQDRPVVHDPRSRAVAIGFGVSVLLSGVLAFLWPIYLRELAESVKDEAATELSKRVVTYIGPAFFLWVISTTIYQFAVGLGTSPTVYRPDGKTLTVTGLVVVQLFLIWIYFYLRRALRSKARVKKPRARPRTA